MTCQYETIERLLYAYGAWLNRDMPSAHIRGGSAWHTITTGEQSRSYWQPCQPCLETGIDLSSVGSGIRRRAELDALRRSEKLRRSVGARLCGACNGNKGHHETAPLADPNAIPSTGPGGMHVPIEDIPPDFQRLEGAISAESIGEVNRAVIWSRYVIWPREWAASSKADGRKARVAWVNQAIYPKTINEEAYKKRLTASKRRLSEVFGIPVRKEDEKPVAEKA